MRIRNFFRSLFNWELWNFYILYAPIAPVWAWYCIRSRAIWFFTPSNPTITFGGFHGEGKREMYDQLPERIVPRTIYIQPGIPFETIEARMVSAGLRYPCIVKPEVGMKGILFRIIENEEQLRRYHGRVRVEYLIQTKVDLPVEVSVFYYRYPWMQQGKVTGLIQKELLHVIGDGTKTLKELIDSHPRASHRLAEMQVMHGHRFDRVIAAGDPFYLSFAGNHNRGARFTNLHHEINQDLVGVFDRLSHQTQFFYGRYDLKIASVADLKAGKNFIVLEYNGAGAEPNHIYDANMSLWQAYQTILHHWRALYRISRYNASFHRYWPFKKGARFLKMANRHFEALEKMEG